MFEDEELLPLTARIYDAIGLPQVRAFEASRREYNRVMNPVWRYVRGGRVLHAFFAGKDGTLGLAPVCGIVPRRVNGLRSPWIEHQGSAGWQPGPRKQHWECSRELRAVQHLRRAEWDREVEQRGASDG